MIIKNQTNPETTEKFTENTLKKFIIITNNTKNTFGLIQSLWIRYFLAKLDNTTTNW